jgi:beta propeller repeat protein
MNTKRITLAAAVSLVLMFTALAHAAEPNSFPICAAAGTAQAYPAVSGNYVVWQDGGSDIYRNNGENLNDANSFLVCNANRIQTNPAISGTTIVWQDYRPSATIADIYRYSLPSGPEDPVCTLTSKQQSPAISGNIIVWQDYRSSNWDIYGYRILNSTEFEICTDPNVQSNPAISGNIVVWQDSRNGYMDIYRKNIDTEQEFPVIVDNNWKQNPAISGNIIVWQDDRNGDNDIYGKNFSTGEEIEICKYAGKEQFYPAISGDIVVWEDYRSASGTADIYGYRISTQTEFPICTRAGNQKNPAISGNFVVWEEYQYDTNGDIYGAYIPAPVAQSIITVTDPNGGEMILAGSNHTITWSTSGTPITRVKIEYSKDGNDCFIAEVNTPNTGQHWHEWQVPSTVDSNQCKIKITDSAVPPAASDASNNVFTIFMCNPALKADLSGDCKVDFMDFALFSGQWLDCGNPRDPAWCP